MESKWMFGHLDLNNDGILSSQELYDLEHDQVRKYLIWMNLFYLAKMWEEIFNFDQEIHVMHLKWTVLGKVGFSRMNSNNITILPPFISFTEREMYKTIHWCLWLGSGQRNELKRMVSLLREDRSAMCCSETSIERRSRRHLRSRLWRSGFLQTNTMSQFGWSLLVCGQAWCGIRQY